MKEVYQGYIYLGSNYEEDDILFIDTFEDPLVEVLEWITRKKVTVRYWICPEKMDVEEAEEEFVKVLIGSADANYCMNYSEYTGYLWTDEELNVGGHNLLDELKSHADGGSYLIMEVETHENQR